MGFVLFAGNVLAASSHTGLDLVSSSKPDIPPEHTYPIPLVVEVNEKKKIPAYSTSSIDQAIISIEGSVAEDLLGTPMAIEPENMMGVKKHDQPEDTIPPNHRSLSNFLDDSTIPSTPEVITTQSHQSDAGDPQQRRILLHHLQNFVGNDTAVKPTTTQNDDFEFLMLSTEQPNDTPTNLAKELPATLTTKEEKQPEATTPINNISSNTIEQSLSQQPIASKQQLRETPTPPAQEPEDILPIEPSKEQEQEQEHAHPDISNHDKAYISLLQKKSETISQENQLSQETKQTLQETSQILLHKKIEDDKQKQQELKKISISRQQHSKSFDPSQTEETEQSKESVANDSASSKVSVYNNNITKRRKNQHEDTLKRAYKALMIGQISAAIKLYKDVLDHEYDNEDALFGLATAYHRNHQLDQAREIYTDILRRDPNHREALNNFIVLAADEAPQDALIELRKLERINPRFSPIPAQIAMIYLKLEQPSMAEQYLKRAITLSPSNVVYRYNLAIISDRLGKHLQAANLYAEVLNAVERGANIPGSLNQVRQRLDYLAAKIKQRKQQGY